MEVFGRTDKGMVRELNEDAFAARSLPDGYFAVVCDGMGGEKAGEIASGIAVEKASSFFSETLCEDLPPEKVDSLTRTAFKTANRAVREYAVMHPSCRGMGTTMVTFAVKGTNVVIGNVGDSRAYYIVDGEIIQITTDHSLVENLIQSGQISREMARFHPKRSVITRALGTDDDINCDTFSLSPKAGSRILLCSDGLTGELSNETILEIADSRNTLETICDDLIESAKASGGRDNITVVLITFPED